MTGSTGTPDALERRGRMTEEKNAKAVHVEKKSHGNRFRRILALVGVILIAGLYIATFVLAVVVNSSELTRMLFRAALVSTVMIPVFLYVVIWLHRVLSKYRYEPEDSKKV